MCVQLCEEFLLEHIATDNAIGIFKLAKYLHCRSLEKQALNFLLKNFLTLSTGSNEFLQLTPDELGQVKERIGRDRERERGGEREGGRERDRDREGKRESEKRREIEKEK